MNMLPLLAGFAALCASLAQGAGFITGKAVEAMDAGRYTYVRLEKGAKSTWVAVPRMKIKAGDAVSFQDGAVMNDFQSKTLGRTFKTIVFSQGPTSATRESSHAGAPAMAKGVSVKMARAEGPDAYTIEEIYARRAHLSGKTVRIRGEVVKASFDIMNRNWIHLQDGSGDAKAGTHDLVVTTSQKAKFGETVTASGAVAADRDFGMGYGYKVILEETSFKR